MPPVIKFFALRLTPLALAMSLVACGGSGDSSLSNPPVGLGREDTAPVPDQTKVPPYVDHAYTNQRGMAQYATLSTNAGVRVVSGFLDLWTPSTLIVDAGQTAAASGDFPAVTASTWSGIPGDATDGKKANAAVLDANIQYVVNLTANRTAEQATAAYLDDRRQKGYSVTDGLGPLTDAWRAVARQTTTITGVPADATTKLYNDGGNNIGVGVAGGNTEFGTVVDFVNSPPNGSTEPAKRFFKYARPWRWSTSVSVVPSLVPAKSSTPTTDGGFISGHSAEAVRSGLMMAYVVPERYAELVARSLELGENRIMAGMHSPLDVIGGRIQAQAVIAAALYNQANKQVPNPAGGTLVVADQREAARTQARTALMTAVGAKDALALQTFAQSGTSSNDRFADQTAMRAAALRRLTFGFSPIAATDKAAVVPKAAELLLETRFPYLSATQRRVVLKSTALPSGYPAMDDAEGWGRLNLFAAAQGYGALQGDVTVRMDAAQGGFHARDTWRNDLSGAGRLLKTGSGELRLAGAASTFTGGIWLQGGTLAADTASALGAGDVYIEQGALQVAASQPVQVSRNLTQLPTGTLQVVLGAKGQGSLNVAGTARIEGDLQVSFAAGMAPKVGDVLPVLTHGARFGSFRSITVSGYKAVAVYSDTGVSLKITGVGA